MSDFNCCLCKRDFCLKLIPYELPCTHIYCFDCLKQSQNQNLNCPKDKKSFDMALDKVPINNLWAKLVQSAFGSNFFEEIAQKNPFTKSEILKNHPNSLFLNKCFDKKIFKLELLYRASENFYSSNGFHALCDFKGPTLVVIRSKLENKVFGGFSSISWGVLPGENYFEADGSFLFQLDYKTKHDIYKNQEKAICQTYQGPHFGGGTDLYVAPFCNKQKSSSNLGYTYSLPNNMEYKSKEAKQYLAGAHEFLIDEYEVFKVNFEKILE